MAPSYNMTTRFSAEEVFTAATRYAFSLLALFIGCLHSTFRAETVWGRREVNESEGF